MTTLGNNLQTYKDRFLYVLEGRFLASSSATHTDALFFSLINEAQRAFQSALRIKREISTALTVTAGTAHYALPSNLLGGDIRQVLCNGVTLKRAAFDLNWLETDAERGEPQYWAMNPNTAGEVAIAPMPDTTTAAALKVLYVASPRNLWRIYNQTVVTASVAYNSATVTLSATPAGMEVGDEFGVVMTAQSDGQASAGESPMAWYRIQSIDTGAKTLTLSEVYAGATKATAAFITAQVSDLEAWRPGRLGMSLAEYAAGLALRSRDAAAGLALMQSSAAQAVADYVGDSAGYDFGAPRTADSFPQLFERY